MDNQQATYGAAMLYMGEGHFILNRRTDKRKKNGSFQTFHTEVGITNQDPAILDFICEWLQFNGIAHFITGCTNAFQIKVQRHGSIKRLIDLLEPHMFGNKLYEAKILRRFIEHRMSKFGGNDARKYDDADFEFHKEMLQRRESSETICVPECWRNHRHITDDIVQPTAKSVD